MTNVGILGLGHYLPKRKLTNRDLEKIVNTSDDWIMTRTGIKERRLAGKKEKNSSLAVKAAKEALRNAKLDMRAALGRESLKTIAAHLATKQISESSSDPLFGLLAGLASRVTVAATSQAETRSWLTLPYSIGVRRIPVSAGAHTVDLNPGAVVGSSSVVSVAPGQIFVLQQRLISLSSLQVAGGTSN